MLGTIQSHRLCFLIVEFFQKNRETAVEGKRLKKEAQKYQFLINLFDPLYLQFKY